jgi:hypothetical protein
MKRISKSREGKKIPSMILTEIPRVRVPIIVMAQATVMEPSLQRLRKVIRVEIVPIPKT